MFLFGKNPVIERLHSAPDTILSLYLQKNKDLSEVATAAKDSGIKFRSVEKAWINKKHGNAHTQGVVAEIRDFKYSSFSDLLSECKADRSVMVFADGVTDPQNLGGMIRNLACMGGFSIILPRHRAAHVNETVLRVANGGENHIPVSIVPNLRNALKNARQNGIWVAGAVAHDGEDIHKAEIPFPLAVVLGSEGKGIRPILKKEMDLGLSLSMKGAPLSYNVTVAAALICFEILRRRGS